MFNKLISWIKNNKLTTVLVLIIIGLILGWRNYGVFPARSRYLGGYGLEKSYSAPLLGRRVSSRKDITSITRSESFPRLVTHESSLSLLVKDVTDVRQKVINEASRLGGYMVSSSFSRPQELPFARITISVPSHSLGRALVYLKSLAIKVASENLYGRDVTDKYIDIQKHIDILRKTKAKYEEIRNKATDVKDLMTVTRELINIQNQIDSYKGQQQKLKNRVNMTQITIYLSTDELVLPYAPDYAFRPKLIFKQAVRSLVRTFYHLVAKLIWLIVYSVVWLPLLLISWFIYRQKQKHSV